MDTTEAMPEAPAQPLPAQGQDDVQQVKRNVNDLLQQLQVTDDPREARKLSAQLNEEVEKLPD